MAMVTVEGVFRAGKVELAETPIGVSDTSRVLVTFLPQAEDQARNGEEDKETLRQRAFARMKKGINLGGPPYPTREELHDRNR